MDDDGSGSLAWIFTVIILIILAGFFAMVETAFASVSESKLKTLASGNDARAKRALRILDEFDVAITTVLICTNIVHIAAAAVVTVNVTKIFGMSFVTLSTLVTTLAVFFFGEMLPKSIARKYCLKICLGTGVVLAFLMKLLRPLSFVLTAIGNAASKLIKGDEGVSVTEDELYDIIEDMTEEGTLDEDSGELISSALQFQDVRVSDITTGRNALIAIDIDMPPEDILDMIRRETHSRLPVYKGSIDNIIGILQIRKYIKSYLANGGVKRLRPLLDKPYFIKGDVEIDEALKKMSSRRKNIAVVTDADMKTIGIITIEDILEELVGDIRDEDEPVPDEQAPEEVQP